MDHDVTERLRKPMKERSRNGYYSDSLNLFARGLEQDSATSAIEMRRRARQAIDAICIFEEEWEIAAMVNEDTDINYCEWNWPL